MMYYDRRLPSETLALLEPSGPLAWLVDWVDSPDGRANLAHIQFRKASGKRVRGGIQLYLGRTSPLECIGKSDRRVELTADKSYRDVTPGIFGHAMPVADLHRIGSDLRTHVADCTRMANRSFLNGEAVAHAGLMRRYGMGHRTGDPLLAVDSEVQAGFGSDLERRDFDNGLRAQLQLADNDTVHRKLDAIGILAEGDIGLVEVKAPGGDLVCAVVQAAVHVQRLQRLNSNQADGLPKILAGMAVQKVGVGLLPSVPHLVSEPKLVPIVAAPDEREDWFAIWKRETQLVRKTHKDLLVGLRFWRLDKYGELQEEQRP